MRHEHKLPRELQDAIEAYDQAELDYVNDVISRSDYDRIGASLEQAIDNWKDALCIETEHDMIAGDVLDTDEGLKLVTPWGTWQLTEMKALGIITALSMVVRGRIERGQIR